jgi:hypothetical protein
MIREQSSDRAKTSSVLTLVTETGGGLGVAACGTYDDELVLEDGIWRIAVRHVLLEVPELPAP